MARIRADLLLVARGLAESRAKAQAAIAAGGVRADGRIVQRASDPIEPDARLEVTPAFPWVSRAGVKLDHALQAFGVSPAARVCLDIGASTGGFSEVLCAHGAARVYAVDVGADQLHPRVRLDPRVISLEQRDARALTQEDIPTPPSLIVCDASFIGLSKILPAPLRLAASSADLIALVKPQFEAGPGAGKHGILAAADARRIGESAARGLDGLEGFALRALVESPIQGGDGNVELLAHYAR